MLFKVKYAFVNILIIRYMTFYLNIVFNKNRYILNIIQNSFVSLL